MIQFNRKVSIISHYSKCQEFNLNPKQILMCTCFSSSTYNHTCRICLASKLDDMPSMLALTQAVASDATKVCGGRSAKPGVFCTQQIPSLKQEKSKLIYGH